MRRLLVAAFAALLTSSANAAAIGSWGVELSDQDRSVRPGDDFFRYQNGGWVSRAAPDVQHPFMSYWRDVRNVAPGRLRAILDGLASDTALPASSPSGKAALLYRDYLDEAAIEKLGHAPLESQLSAIRLIRTRADAARIMGRMEGPLKLRASILRDGSSAGLFTLNVGQDAGNPARNVLILGQGGIGLPDPSYYSAPEVADVRAKYQDYVATILGLVGWREPEARAREIVAFETAIAKASTPLEQLVDPARTYHPMSYAELKQLAPGLDWAAFFEGAGMKPPVRVVIDDPQAFRRIAVLFAHADVSMLRARQAFAAADYDASLLSHDLYAAKVAFRTNVLNTASLSARDRKDGGERLVEAVVPDVLGSIYVARFVPPEVDARAKAMGETLRSALDARLARAEWLSPQSREAARRKLAAMQIRLGYPERFDDYRQLALPGAGLYADVHAAASYKWREQVASLSQPFDRSRWFLPPMYPQYAYDPQSNSAEVAAALFQAPFFDPAADDAVNYGAVGTIVASQIMGAFDARGINYDASGRLRPLLNGVERARVEQVGQALAERYSAFEPVPGVHPRGRVLFLEAMSDIGSIDVALDAYRLSLGGKDPPIVDGLTGEQRFFLGRAQSWRARFTSDAIRNQLTQGSNAIPWMRVNGPLPNIDAWYSAFDVKPGDKLYLPPAERLHVW